MGLGPIGATGDSSFKADPNQLAIRKDADGTRVSGHFNGKPIQMLFGADGSKAIYSINAGGDRERLNAEQSKGFARDIVRAYLEAPEQYGTSNSADKYQDVLNVVAATLGVHPGVLIGRFER